jgi:hypothetical protein
LLSIRRKSGVDKPVDSGIIENERCVATVRSSPAQAEWHFVNLLHKISAVQSVLIIKDSPPNLTARFRLRRMVVPAHDTGAVTA